MCVREAIFKIESLIISNPIVSNFVDSGPLRGVWTPPVPNVGGSNVSLSRTRRGPTPGEGKLLARDLGG